MTNIVIFVVKILNLMKKHILLFAAVSLFAAFSCSDDVPEIDSQWNGAKVAFLGDSITDANQIGRFNDTYWNMLRDILGIEPLVYGLNGHQMSQITGQAEKLEAEHGQDVDAIVVFAGTNDYNADVPMGEWYDCEVCDVERDGRVMVPRRHRTLLYDEGTFCGRTNSVLKYLKSHFPTRQIILLTPIHRGYATFGDDNIQPCEEYANACGLFIDDYVQALKDAGNVWAVPVIDLNAACGLYPLEDGQTGYFRNADTDRLHPNTEGHVRMAYTLAYQLLAYPSRFKLPEND